MAERISSYSKYMKEGGAAASCFQQHGVRIDIPQRFLWGRQKIREYCGSNLIYVKHALAREGKAYLDKHPIAVVFVSADEGSFLTIYDGHHRARTAPAFGIRQIPSEVVCLDQLAAYLDRNTTELKEIFDRQRQSAYESFWWKAKILEAPKYVDRHIRTLGELSKYFQDLTLRESMTRSLPYNPEVVRVASIIPAMQTF